ncbi:hypothetical protein DFH07DRAFT_840302 [Mycena maculata]|uniref:Uncharacterized protein n=1 Tax=Mycena maculata TaxID=230809 RepID=A0AAD7MZN7_9AGAR|nr:hypothetical protein DFH07DRAFT_840302 [Mycena maculata]
MAFLSLASLYRLVLVLCLLQIVSGICTIRVFGLTLTGGSHFVQMLFVALSIPMLYYLTKCSRRTDRWLSRVDHHILVLACLITNWGMATLITLFFQSTIDFTVIISPCANEMFMIARCAPVVLNTALPIASISILYHASGRIARRARDIHGEEMVVLPQKIVPAWSLGTVSETDSDRVELEIGA